MHKRYRQKRQSGSSLAEFAPAMMIFIMVMFFFIAIGFYLVGVSTGNYAAQLAAREAASAGTRAQAIQRARTVITSIAANGFGRFSSLSGRGGVPLANGMTLRFSEMNGKTIDEQVTGTQLFRDIDPTNRLYQVRVELQYRLAPPFVPTSIPQSAASEAVCEHPEGLNIVN